MNPERLRILKQHKQWADRYLLVWLAFALAMLSGFEVFLEFTGIGAAERAGVAARARRAPAPNAPVVVSAAVFTTSRRLGPLLMPAL